MLNPDTELLFPLRVVPLLAEARGEVWREFIEKLCSSETDRVDQVAFVMMMVRLGGCIGCNADSFRAMRGCTKCTQQSIKRYRGEDNDLIKLYEKAKQEILVNKKNS